MLPGGILMESTLDVRTPMFDRQPRPPPTLDSLHFDVWQVTNTVHYTARLCTGGLHTQHGLEQITIMFFSFSFFISAPSSIYGTYVATEYSVVRTLQRRDGTRLSSSHATSWSQNKDASHRQLRFWRILHLNHKRLNLHHGCGYGYTPWLDFTFLLKFP